MKLSGLSVNFEASLPCSPGNSLIGIKFLIAGGETVHAEKLVQRNQRIYLRIVKPPPAFQGIS